MLPSQSLYSLDDIKKTHDKSKQKYAAPAFKFSMLHVIAGNADAYVFVKYLKSKFPNTKFDKRLSESLNNCDKNLDRILCAAEACLHIEDYANATFWGCLYLCRTLSFKTTKPTINFQNKEELHQIFDQIYEHQNEKESDATALEKIKEIREFDSQFAANMQLAYTLFKQERTIRAIKQPKTTLETIDIKIQRKISDSINQKP